MAKRKKKKRSSRCQIKVVCGVKRRLCRDSKGRITSSKAVSKSRKKAAKKRKSTGRKKSCPSGTHKVCRNWSTPRGGGKRRCRKWVCSRKAA